MKIEQVINQTKPFSTAYEKLIVNMVYTNIWLATSQKEFFSKYGLTGKQYNILRILRGAGEPISTSTIRSRMLEKMSDSSRIVDRLEKKELVTKTFCAHDNRKVDVSLTKEATLLLKKIDKTMPKWQGNFSNLTEKEANQLSDLLDKMRK